MEILQYYNNLQEVENTTKVKMQRPFSETNRMKILELQYFLEKNQYFSRDSLPGIADALMFEIFEKEVPERKLHPSLTFWYITMKQFSPNAIKNWKIKSENDQYFSDVLESYKNFISRGSNPQTEIYFAHDPPQIQHEYLINIKFNPAFKQDMIKFTKKLDTQRVQIAEYEVNEEEGRVQVRCDQESSEKMRTYVNSCKDIRLLEIKKIKNSKLGRLRTLSIETS